MIIVPNLRVKMAERGLTIKEVHEKTNLSRTTISNLYNGYSDGIKFETLEKLCGLLKCTPNDLLKILETEISSLIFSKINQDEYNNIEYSATFNLKINDIIKKIETSIIAEIYIENEDIEFYTGNIYIHDPYIISEDEFNISSNNIDKVNNSLESLLLNEFSKSPISKKLFSIPPNIEFSY
ncbi:helix-turn-helix transcriptional regulator [Mammaliicoccus sp. A-M2]|uniref:helix-turn-helix domain-containing protein n=1 Tax=Mammaliicoccus sp. A-M2 TaxID=2898662 RepID=UPI001EFB28F6|nr:helix-turn-helix transcriptional regulator [Mammaliicoccus sp. A-M2]